MGACSWTPKGGGNQNVKSKHLDKNVKWAKATYFHVGSVTKNLSGGPAAVAASPHYIMGDHIGGFIAVHLQSEANSEGCIILQGRESE